MAKKVLIPKDEAAKAWKQLKADLKEGRIKFEDYAARKRRLKPSILQKE